MGIEATRASNPASAEGFEDPHKPFQVPESVQELEQTLAELTRGMLPGGVAYVRKQLIAGCLTPPMLEEQRSLEQ
jgi:hypothetical protein